MRAAQRLIPLIWKPALDCVSLEACMRGHAAQPEGQQARGRSCGLHALTAALQARAQARREFKAFCAANPMDIVSVECQPEACVLAKGRASNASAAVGALDGAAPKTPLLAGLLASLPVPAKTLAKNLGLPAAALPGTLDVGSGGADDAERADSRAERMLESGSAAAGGGAGSLAAQLMERQGVCVQVRPTTLFRAY